MRLGLALKAFFSVLGNRETANRVQAAIKTPLLESKAAPVAKSEATPPKSELKESARGRSEALTLIATLQRELASSTWSKSHSTDTPMRRLVAPHATYFVILRRR